MENRLNYFCQKCGVEVSIFECGHLDLAEVSPEWKKEEESKPGNEAVHSLPVPD